MRHACPCFSGKPYAECCQPLHQGQAAATAEQLMRSRYSAYVLRLADYLVRTWHASTRPASLSVADLNGIKWLKLAVVAATETGDHAEVTFIATYQSGKQKKAQLHEHSAFTRVDGQWLYQGEVATTAGTPSAAD